MTLAEISSSLPNGFHDAKLMTLDVDFSARVLNLRLAIWVGDMAVPTTRERYRPAQVYVSGLQFMVIEPPDSRYPFLKGPLTVDLMDADASLAVLGSLTPESFAARLYVGQWNAFIHIGALDARLTWVDA